MADRPLKLDDALRVLRDSGHALSSGAIAQAVHASDLDVHVLMLTAKANRLAYTTHAGEWALTERGRRGLQDVVPRPQARRFDR